MAAIFSPLGLGCTAKYASRDRFSGAAMEVRLRFFSPGGSRPLFMSRSRLAWEIYMFFFGYIKRGIRLDRV